MPKKPALFTHVGTVSVTQQFCRRCESEQMYLRVTPKRYVGWLPEHQKLKFPQSGGRYDSTKARKNLDYRTYTLDLNTVREATQEDHLAYYQAEVDKAHAHLLWCMEVAEKKARELIAANKKAYEATTAHDRALAEMMEFTGKAPKQ